MARREINVFSLSFLDVMSCGLGAIILFYIIINAQVAVRANQANTQLLSETNRLEEQVLDGRKNLVRLRASLSQKEQQEQDTATAIASLQARLAQLRAELAVYQGGGGSRQSLAAMEADIRRLQAQRDELAARVNNKPKSGTRLRSYVGEGNREYLTGMKMGGQRVMILVDASTSMLGRTLVNVVRFSLMSDDVKVRAPKWQQVVNTVDWLTTHLKPGTSFQIYTFNDTAHSVMPGTDGSWIPVTDGSKLTAAVNDLRRLVPHHGTSLYQAVAAVRAMNPPPDNVYLLTDGLPTQGKTPPQQVRQVGPDQRARFFQEAFRDWPRRLPVNVILYPMEGDPDAAGYFWALAFQSRGSFLSPSTDWP